MAKSCSFDIVSEVNMPEVQNAVNQSMMEIRQRYDFKGSKSEITLESKEGQLTLISDDEHKLNTVIDVLQGKLVRRKVSLKALDYGKVEPAAGSTVRQVIKIDKVCRHYAPLASSQDTTDGYSFEFKSWRFNLRKSNTEPLVRLNVETRNDPALLKEKTSEILSLLGGQA